MAFAFQSQNTRLLKRSTCDTSSLHRPARRERRRKRATRRCSVFDLGDENAHQEVGGGPDICQGHLFKCPASRGDFDVKTGAWYYYGFALCFGSDQEGPVVSGQVGGVARRESGVSLLAFFFVSNTAGIQGNVQPSLVRRHACGLLGRVM